MPKQVSFNEDAEVSTFRVESDKSTKNFKRYGVSADMRDMAKTNGVATYTNGSVYVPSADDMAGPDVLYVTISTEPPKGWTDPTVKKSKKS